MVAAKGFAIVTFAASSITLASTDDKTCNQSDRDKLAGPEGQQYVQCLLPCGQPLSQHDACLQNCTDALGVSQACLDCAHENPEHPENCGVTPIDTNDVPSGGLKTAAHVIFKASQTPHFKASIGEKTCDQSDRDKLAGPAGQQYVQCLLPCGQPLSQHDTCLQNCTDALGVSQSCLDCAHENPEHPENCGVTPIDTNDVPSGGLKTAAHVIFKPSQVPHLKAIGEKTCDQSDRDKLAGPEGQQYVQCLLPCGQPLSQHDACLQNCTDALGVSPSCLDCAHENPEHPENCGVTPIDTNGVPSGGLKTAAHIIFKASNVDAVSESGVTLV